ncbi:MAG: hypothetical protein HZB51_25730 [Chloroflexi bacterium]|nr:hypothetical protein [Chloroflexota bacterium]
MFHKNVRLARAAWAIALGGLAALTIIGVFAVVTKQVVGLPIVLLVLFGWGGMFLLQVVLPIVAVIHVLAWLNRKLFSQA